MIAPLRKQYTVNLFRNQPGEGYGLVQTPFLIDVVPPGQIWTGSLMITISNQPSGTAVSPSAIDTYYNTYAFNSLLENVLWTFYRNNNAEFSWTGFSVPTNIQLFSNDACAVVGQFTTTTELDFLHFGHTTSIPDFNIQLTLAGYAGDETEIPLVTPGIVGPTKPDTQVVGAQPQATLLQVANVTATFTAGSHTLIPTPLSPANLAPQIQVWSASVVLSCWGSANTSAAAEIQTNDGTDILGTGVQLGPAPAGSSTTQTSSLDQSMAGLVVGKTSNTGTNTQFPINLVVTTFGAPAPATTTSATVVYSKVVTVPGISGP